MPSKVKRQKDEGRIFLLLNSYFLLCGRHRSTAKPMSESIDHSWICREDFGIERNQSFKGDHGNAQFSLCCTSTAMPDDDLHDRHPAFLFLQQLDLMGTPPRKSRE